LPWLILNRERSIENLSAANLFFPNEYAGYGQHQKLGQSGTRPATRCFFDAPFSVVSVFRGHHLINNTYDRGWQDCRTIRW
ncbi:MAG: hypothetical protein AB7E77_08465, partial [Desulfobulbus sp.]